MSVNSSYYIFDLFDTLKEMIVVVNNGNDKLTKSKAIIIIFLRSFMLLN